MSLLITIIKSPDSVAPAVSSKTFDMQGGSIGRGKNNSWVLDDPERFLSACHCQFSCENGQFYITDLSTNGTFFSDSPNPMGNGTKLPVKDGDTFALGEYEFSVSLTNAEAIDDPFASSMPSSSSVPDDIFSSPSAGSNGFAQDNFADSPFASGHVSSSEPLFSVSTEETDPLAALDKAQGGSLGTGNINPVNTGSAGFGSSDDPFAGPSHSDQADVLHQQVSWPDAVPEQTPPDASGIPDDWNDELMSPTAPAQPIPPATPKTPPVVPKPAQVSAPQAAESVADSQAKFQITGQFDAAESDVIAQQNLALKKANTKLLADIEILKQRFNAQQGRVKSDVTVDTTLVDAMGFQTQNFVDAEITQMNQLVGEVVREMVSGLMQVLGSRSSIKNEFRMNVTTIQPVENNPLKFSANVDDALENMFIKQGNAYKKPVEAVREGFEGIAEHQVAILAGIRAAFKGIIERFDPVLLEARFSKLNKGGLIPGSQKAKNWELYLDYYNELVGDIDNTFQYLFGDDFVQAYEDQLQKLAISRKAKNQKQ
jgi:type VI secretion system FHA domain protein